MVEENWFTRAAQGMDCMDSTPAVNGKMNGDASAGPRARPAGDAPPSRAGGDADTHPAPAPPPPAQPPAPPILDVEIVLKLGCATDRARICKHAREFLTSLRTVTTCTTYMSLGEKLSASAAEVAVFDRTGSQESRCYTVSECQLVCHPHRLEESGPEVEEVEDEAGDMPAATQWILPSRDFHGLWDSLIYETNIKQQLLNFVSTTLLFSDKGVNGNVISWNRVVLLHGPPGTGKTSLCKALAQKLAIRMSDRYAYGQLIEINSHSLFSKWFSESGKLVQKMFTKIQELIDDPKALVCVLIDEVESLTAARRASSSSAEPSDAIRVVNALLTQIDQIKRFPNVLILTTSNITGAIDLAFVDRADIKQFIDLPSPAAIYKIYRSCVEELVRTRIISSAEKLFSLHNLELTQYVGNAATQSSLRLWQIAQASRGLSGRTLRKLPFLAHALFITTPSATMCEFLSALEAAVAKQFQDRTELSNS
ncbi:pachytene checkpoint protein 2 homolog [Amphibalanus amphitrite]|uniref:pachytene checkpoint protein 2 homolog n=1 Tax=Amphibalanus amphitrite TaxID=1232801 RepID=UPI001C90782D|nr:pachytene checkpoint protein 2 homolog [Amphibalanus amphitrite]